VKLILITFGALILATEAMSQKLVDPKTVAPQYREAAEKRRAEQISQRECAHKADVDKVMPRERTAYLLHCLAAADTASLSASGAPSKQ
jgi:hypothetical protein